MVLKSEFVCKLKIDLLGVFEKLVMEEYKVICVIYEFYKKDGCLDLICVNYNCGLCCFFYYILFEYGGNLCRCLEDWWMWYGGGIMLLLINVCCV